MGKRFFLFFVLALGLVAFDARADFQTGMAAYGDGDYAGALKEWEPAAQQGDVYAQHMMGFLYAKGRGVKRDLGRAVSWWTRAAESGHPPAQFVLGKIYLKGIGVAPDIEAGARWIERAAEAGFAEAQIFYGALYAKGEGVPRDLVQAYMWLDLAASVKNREPGTFWDTITPYLTPKEIRAANKQINKWNSGKD